MTVEVSNTAERRRSTRFHLLIFRDQEPPLLNVIAFNCPVETVIAHRILPQGRFDQRISEHAQLRAKRSNPASWSFRDGARATKSKAILRRAPDPESRDSGLASSRRPGMTTPKKNGLLPPSRSRASADSCPAKLAQGERRRVVALLLAVTSRRASTISPRIRASFTFKFPPLRNQRAQGMPGAG